MKMIFVIAIAVIYALYLKVGKDDYEYFEDD